jgi:hypothetical protein
MPENDKHEKGCGNVSPQPDPIQAAIYYGIDVNTLRDNLSRTPAEQIRGRQIVLNTAKKLRQARRK